MNAHRSRSSLVAAAAGALLLVTGCAGGPEPPPFLDRTPFWVQDSLPGTLSVFLHVPGAELRLEFPADARAGEQASGTLGIRTGDGYADGPLPVGHPLHGHRLLLGSTEVDPGASRFRVSVPEAAESLRAQLLDAEGRVQAEGEIPLGGEPAPRVGPDESEMLPPYVPDAGG